MTQFRSMSIRIMAAFIVFVAVFGYLIFHLYQVQVVRHDELLEKARKKYTTKKVTNGRRGEIFDYSGYLLVGNRPYGIVFADPSGISPKKFDATVEFLSKELSLDSAELKKHLSKRQKIITRNGKQILIPNQYYLLKNKIPFDEYEAFRDKLAASKLKAIYCSTGYSRYYPKNSMLANILGISTMNRGKVVAVGGVEKSFTSSMNSVEGELTYERAMDGLPLSFGETTEKAERDGADIYLTIREPIQSIVEEELDKLVAQHHPRAAYAVMADPATGDILAIAQRPTFNPNDRSTMNADCWRNRCVEDVYEPGSIMKPIAVAGAIDKGIVTPDTMFDCERGRWFYAGKILKDSHAIGNVSVTEIIKQSSNIGTAKIALAMGKENLNETLRAFGFGSRTGIQLPHESRGIFRKLEQWKKISLTRFPIGQGIAVSPLQLIRAYCMLANGGHPVRLRLIDRTVYPDKPPVKVVRPVSESIYKRAATHKEMITMLKSVTEPGGTAAIAAIRGYNVAGKTGTAQKFVNGQYSHSKYTASFIGFVPADNPRLVLLVTTDEPGTKAYYGGTVSGPYFKSIAERTLRYMCVPPDIDPEKYDAERKAANHKVLEAKKKLWAEERMRKEMRAKGLTVPSSQSVLKNTGKDPVRKDPKKVSAKKSTKAAAGSSGRYNGTYTSMKKKNK